MKIYKSKIDSWFWMLMPITLFITIFPAFLLNVPVEVWICYGITALLIIGLFILMLRLRYVIDSRFLTIKMSFWTKKIDIKTIRKIEKNRTLLSSPALSIDKIEIFYNKYDSILISPKEKTKFIANLLEINPEIEVTKV